MLPRAKEIVEAAGLKMQDAVDFLEEDLKNYRVGKATPAIFNGVTVESLPSRPRMRRPSPSSRGSAT